MKLTPWITVYGHCATRCLINTDINEIKNRVAFIEKSARIRVAPFTNESDDFKNWKSGPRGSGGGNPEIDFTYGFDRDSRKWCDEELKKLGYIFD